MIPATDERRPTDVRLPGELRWLLARLRWSIRAYAWLEGLATAAVWLAAAFFMLWLFDWAFEPAWNVRRAAMFVAVAGLAAIVYRSILRRTFARLPRASLAALVERRHGEFGDRLLTAVNLCDRAAATDESAAGGDPSADRERGVMLEQTVAEARVLARNVRVREVFNGRPLVVRAFAAAALLAALAVAWFVAGDALAFYLQRLGGSPEPWPRKTLLLVEGFWAEYALVVPEASPTAADEVHVHTGAVDVLPRDFDEPWRREPIAVAAGAAAHVAENGALKAAAARGTAEIVEPFAELDRFVPASDAGGIAVLRRAADCLWRGDARAYRAGAKLSLGRYELISGRAEIVMNGGTRIVVAGPAAFEIVASTKLVLDRGRATVRAPLRPAPFVVETPRATYTASPVEEIKVVRGGDATLTVLADALRTLPEFVEAAYEGEGGGAGRQMLQQEAAAIPGRDEFQRYTLALKNVVGSLELDIRGGDGRVSGVKIATVDSPKLVAARAACRFPTYLVDEESGRFTPRAVDVSGPIELPLGTDVTLQARASKPLRRVEVVVDGEKHAVDASGDGYDFAFPLGRLERTTAVFLTLHDADGVANREPIPLQLIAVPDEPPRAAVKLFGVGSTIVPNALLRLQGEIADDHALDRAWFEIAAAGEDAAKHPLAAAIHDSRRVVLATSPWRGQTQATGDNTANPSSESLGESHAESLDLGAFRLPSGRALKPGDQLMVSVRAADRCDLRAKETLGESDRVQLEVVTVDDLLGRLEAREVLIRDKLATIVEELEQTRDALGELAPRTPAAGTAIAPSASRQKGPQVERAAQNSERSSYEVATVANALDEMGEELVANRLDTSERRARLADKLIVPLREVVAQEYPKFDAALAVLRERALAVDQREQLRAQVAALKAEEEAAAKDLADRITALEARLGGGPPTEQLVAAAEQRADQIAVALRAVLGELADAGDFNQLVEELREIGKRQQQLRERTRKEQQKSLLE